MIQCFTVRAARDELVHSNRNAEKWRRDRLKRNLGPQATAAARSLKPIFRATVWVGVVKGNRNVYDPANLTDSLKSVVDSLVKAGVLTDDNMKYARGPWLIHLGYDKRLRDVVKFVVCLDGWETTPDRAISAMRAHLTGK